LISIWEKKDAFEKLQSVTDLNADKELRYYDTKHLSTEKVIE
jgi:hypothetical protein